MKSGPHVPRLHALTTIMRHPAVLLQLATDEYISSNNGTDIAIPCADDYELPTEADIVCQQVSRTGQQAAGQLQWLIG